VLHAARAGLHHRADNILIAPASHAPVLLATGKFVAIMQRKSDK
jgi:hypothetical protein